MRNIVIRIILGLLVGTAAGFTMGYIGKCSGGGCPLTCNPVGGVIFGIIIGLAIATAPGRGRDSDGGKNER